jgi:L-rhamnose isomerase
LQEQHKNILSTTSCREVLDIDSFSVITDPLSSMLERSVKTQEFWNQAFLAALSHLPAPEAKKEADLAVELYVSHWQTDHSAQAALLGRILNRLAVGAILYVAVLAIALSYLRG